MIIIEYTPIKNQEKCIAGYELLNDKSKSLDERIEGAEMLFRALYERSYFYCTIYGHPDYFEYAAMLLNGSHFKNLLGHDIYEIMVSHYGRKPGIKDGFSYWDLECNKL